MPEKWGGPGLSLLDQVIVEEEFGKVTNCLWDIPWRPASVLAYGTEAQREKYLLPVIRGERFDAFAVTEPGAGGGLPVDIAVNRADTHQVAWEADEGTTDRKTLHAKAAIAKLAASEAAGRVVDRCVQIFGGRGYDRSSPVERLYRELRVDRIWEGTSEIQRLIIARQLIKRGTGVLQIPSAG